MRIESLKALSDGSGRFWLTFEDGSRICLYRQTVEDFGLYTGKDLTEEQLLQLQDAKGTMSAKMRAVRIIAASAVSKQDLQKRLVQKGENPDDAAEAVAWMEEMALLDDAETARQIVSRCIAKGYGISRAKQALYEKRIPKEYWEEALSDYPQQLEVIGDYLKAHLDAESDMKEIKKAVDALIRRGHSYGTIRRVLNTLSFDTEQFPEE